MATGQNEGVAQSTASMEAGDQSLPQLNVTTGCPPVDEDLNLQTLKKHWYEDTVSLTSGKRKKSALLEDIKIGESRPFSDQYSDVQTNKDLFEKLRQLPFDSEDCVTKQFTDYTENAVEYTPSPADLELQPLELGKISNATKEDLLEFASSVVSLGPEIKGAVCKPLHLHDGTFRDNTYSVGKNKPAGEYERCIDRLNCTQFYRKRVPKVDYNPSEPMVHLALDHHGVPECLGIIQLPDGNDVFIEHYIKYQGGQTLRKFVEKSVGNIPEAIIISIAEQLLDIMIEAHKKDICLLCLTPDSLIIKEHDGEYTVKLLDTRYAFMPSQQMLLKNLNSNYIAPEVSKALIDFEAALIPLATHITKKADLVSVGYLINFMYEKTDVLHCQVKKLGGDVMSEEELDDYTRLLPAHGGDFIGQFVPRRCCPKMKYLLKAIMQDNPDKRPTAEEAKMMTSWEPMLSFIEHEDITEEERVTVTRCLLKKCCFGQWHGYFNGKLELDKYPALTAETIWLQRDASGVLNVRIQELESNRVVEKEEIKIRGVPPEYLPPEVCREVICIQESQPQSILQPTAEENSTVCPSSSSAILKPDEHHQPLMEETGHEEKAAVWSLGMCVLYMMLKYNLLLRHFIQGHPVEKVSIVEMQSIQKNILLHLSRNERWIKDNIIGDVCPSSTLRQLLLWMLDRKSGRCSFQEAYEYLLEPYIPQNICASLTPQPLLHVQWAILGNDQLTKSFRIWYFPCNSSKVLPKIEFWYRADTCGLTEEIDICNFIKPNTAYAVTVSSETKHGRFSEPSQLVEAQPEAQAIAVPLGSHYRNTLDYGPLPSKCKRETNLKVSQFLKKRAKPRVPSTATITTVSGSSTAAPSTIVNIEAALQERNQLFAGTELIAEEKQFGQDFPHFDTPPPSETFVLPLEGDHPIALELNSTSNLCVPISCVGQDDGSAGPYLLINVTDLPLLAAAVQNFGREQDVEDDGQKDLQSQLPKLDDLLSQENKPKRGRPRKKKP